MIYQINKSNYLALFSDNMKGGAYNCRATNRFNDICVEAPDGKYDTKEICMETCIDRYIHNNLSISKLAKETTGYYNLIKDLLAENMDIYLKGGTVLGLYILQNIYKQTPKKLFKKKFLDYLKHDLIRDWDFACYTKDKKITPEYRDKLDGMADKYGMVPRAKTFILYQTKFPIKINDNSLFEISILEHNDRVNLELPMTTITMRITLDNIYPLFMLANCFYLYYVKRVNVDIPYIKHVINTLQFIVPPYKDGLFLVNDLSPGSMSNPLLLFIKKFSKNDINLQQFLITHFIEPNRMMYRLLSKNIPKTIKINNYYRDNKFSKKKIDILIDPKINKVIESFINELSNTLHDMCIDHPNDASDRLNDFFEGVNLDRLRIEYPNMLDEGKNLIRLLFNRIHRDVKSDDTNQVSRLIRFLKNKKLFD